MKNLKSLMTYGHFLFHQNSDFGTCPSKGVIKRNASGKEGMLQMPENLQNVQEMCLWQKAPRAH